MAPYSYSTVQKLPRVVFRSTVLSAHGTERRSFELYTATKALIPHTILLSRSKPVYKTIHSPTASTAPPAAGEPAPHLSLATAMKRRRSSAAALSFIFLALPLPTAAEQVATSVIVTGVAAGVVLALFAIVLACIFCCDCTRRRLERKLETGPELELDAPMPPPEVEADVDIEAGIVYDPLPVDEPLEDRPRLPSEIMARVGSGVRRAASGRVARLSLDSADAVSSDVGSAPVAASGVPTIAQPGFHRDVVLNGTDRSFNA